MRYDTIWAWWSVMWLAIIEAATISNEGWNGIWQGFILWGILGLFFTWLWGPTNFWQTPEQSTTPLLPMNMQFSDENVPARRGHPDSTRPDTEDFAGLITTELHRRG